MEALLKLEELSVNFPSETGLVAAVSGVNLTLEAGAITCLVGESGCGKSLTCRAILRLLPEGCAPGGAVIFDGLNLFDVSEKKMRSIRGKSIGMIFQEPMTSLNPVLKVGEQAAEPLRGHLGMGKREAREKVCELFAQVGIPSPRERYNDYPHQLSGGMRQRVMIAMALGCGPRLLLADEPTTALDATIQGQILRLISQESRERGMGVLLITHDLGVVAEIADYVGVMYAGLMMEKAPLDEMFENPLHPYTRGLMRAAPSRSSIGLKRLPTIPGTVPKPDDRPPGCPFEPRCPDAMPICARFAAPHCVENHHHVSCWLYAKNRDGEI